MNLLRVPNEVSMTDIYKNGLSWSPSMYQQVFIPNSNVRKVRDFLDPDQLYDKGVEPGSRWYLRKSKYNFIRTKALQNYSYLLSFKGDAIIPINAKVFKDFHLKDTDILISKDSNVGECAMVGSLDHKNYMFSGGIVRIHPTFDKYYVFSFLKHPIFKIQLQSSARGSTIRHAKELWLEKLIPLPNQIDSSKVIRYISALTQVIVEKEKEIRKRHKCILSAIENELSGEYDTISFNYSYPSIDDIFLSSRIDVGLYCYGFQKIKHKIDNYKFGSTCLSEMGIRSRRGQNLAVSVIGKSLYADESKPGWYQLIRPVNLSEYGTLEKMEWLGNKNDIPTVKEGELILGCEGFEKGRSMVLIDGLERAITNFHGTILYWKGAELWQLIFVRCFLAYLREMGVIDWVGVGGSGGHMSPQYFDYLPFPKFPDYKKIEISQLYHKFVPPPKKALTIDNFVDWHREWNENLGIWELYKEMKNLKCILLDVQDKIIEGKTVKIVI